MKVCVLLKWSETQSGSMLKRWVSMIAVPVVKTQFREKETDTYGWGSV
ncbi:MAG: hypothetical protein K0B11_18630 [Mariniphaga sp.]|nr:hypothetical protein [Mariniphaga sp.]